MLRFAFAAWTVLAALSGGCTPEQWNGNVDWARLDMTRRSWQKIDDGGKVASSTPDKAWVDVPAGHPWKYIVIHHSAEPKGNAATIDAAHRARGWDELGYHFVIDNGDGGPDGRVEVGSRWRSQKWGAHTGNTPDNAYNKYGIGICLVGDYTGHMPSKTQLAQLERLVRYLCAKYDISPKDVIGHRDAPGAKTECPGDQLHEWILGTFRPSLARSGA